MTHRKRPLVPCLAIALTLVIGGIAQQPATEAPTGFDTPLVIQTPGSKSVSNGINQPSGDTFANDQRVFEKQFDADTGLGPVFNAQSCVTCHQSPVTGGASQMTELRVGHTDISGNFVNPTVPINDGKDAISGRSIINDRAVCAEAQERVPETENIRALRAVLNTLGDGFVEAIDDSTLTSIAERQP